MIELTPPQVRMLRVACESAGVAVVTAKIEGRNPTTAEKEADALVDTLCIGLGQGRDEVHGRLSPYKWAKLHLDYYAQQPVATSAAFKEETKTDAQPTPARDAPRRKRGRPRKA